MFGHNDHSQNQNDEDQTVHPGNDGGVVEPIADGALSNNDTGGGAPPANDAGASDADSSDTDNQSIPVNDADDTAPSDEDRGSGGDDDGLLSIKQQALQQLSPLVDHLDQSPEEKFKTTMMMIQASDDKSLVKTAYEAAKQIGEEKARAQALLDVVNEINYFTQHQQQ